MSPWGCMAPSRRPTSPSHWVVEEARRTARRDHAFDRMAYARAVLRRLSPDRVRIAIHEGRFDLRVDEGRVWSEQDVRWAVVAIPPDASRELIAGTLVRLAGEADRPFLLASLLAMEPV